MVMNPAHGQAPAGCNLTVPIISIIREKIVWKLLRNEG
jgi:hypothetical protein